MRERHHRTSARRRALGVCVAGAAALLTTTPASATTAVFFPTGSTARVQRQHVTVAITSQETISWSAVDVSGFVADVGVIVAIKPGGRVELAGRVFIDVVEASSEVVVRTLAPGDCKPVASGTVGGDGGISVTLPSASGSGDVNGGCNEGCSNDGSGKGGCYSNNSSSGGGCGGCAPSDHGHPGCSAFFACSPADEKGGSSGSPGDDGGVTRVGPYEVTNVRASDGSALAWLTAHGYDPGLSFAEGAAAVEKDGYQLVALRSRSPAAASLVESIRVIDPSKTPSIPLRPARMGAASTSPSSPITLAVVASQAQQLAGVSLSAIDSSLLSWNGAASNYETLVTAALGGGGGDGGADAGATSTRWIVESSRSLANRRTATSDGGDAGASEPETIADLFHAQCGEPRPETDQVCTPGVTAGDAGISDAGAPVDEAGAPVDAGTPTDGGADAGAADAGTQADAGAGSCTDVDRTTCDDLDLAVAPNGGAVVTRFRGVVAGEASLVADLTLQVATEPLPDGQLFVRADGQAGLCEPTGELSVSASGQVDGSGNCKQVPMRRGVRLDLGPLVLVLAAIRSVAAIMRRARK